MESHYLPLTRAAVPTRLAEWPDRQRMRKQFCDAMVARRRSPHGVPDRRPRLHGAGAAAEGLGERFINAGVAEQNMVSVAAGLAREGLEAWVYSIAPFCYARPFEQIRNDVCLHELPVNLVGNGGGYGYGVMGPTHHAIEDYGVAADACRHDGLRPGLRRGRRCGRERVGAAPAAAYLRLGRGEQPPGYRCPPMRRGAARRATGRSWSRSVRWPGLAARSCRCLRRAPEPVGVGELPLKSIRCRRSSKLLAEAPMLCVVEEHVQRGSSPRSCASPGRGMPSRFGHLCARAHHYGRYGSQAYLRERRASTQRCSKRSPALPPAC